MKIKCFPKIIDKKQAMDIAKGGGNALGKILYGKKDVNMRLMYLESKYIIYNMEYSQNVVSKLFKKKNPLKNQKIIAMIDGTRCTASYVPDDIKTEMLDIDEEDIQFTEFGDEELIAKGKDMCRRMVRRQMGSYITLDMESMISIFRPYYIAFYGDLVEGTKVRYLPIAADGNEVKRTF